MVKEDAVIDGIRKEVGVSALSEKRGEVMTMLKQIEAMVLDLVIHAEETDSFVEAVVSMKQVKASLRVIGTFLDKETESVDGMANDLRPNTSKLPFLSWNLYRLEPEDFSKMKEVEDDLN